ncbi:MAG: hypothetical protein FWD11_12115, partial [Micrococcales bacterium]|nr:hypothetical protein [Micrococcales bacterium]
AIDFLASHGDPCSADVEQAIGYAWYVYPFWGPTRDEQIAKHLGNALRIDPRHRYALLYTAHHHFDCGRYSEALQLLEEFGPTEFGDAYDQGWRDTKNAELILCCKLHLRDSRDLVGAARTLFESLTRLEPETNPEPVELARALLALMLQEE